MRIAREGFPLILIAAVLTLLALLAHWLFSAAVLGLVTLALAGFFRDPERVIPAGEGLVVSPADGRVVSIAKVVDDPFFTEAATRISIFLSPLDVHINRVPVAGHIAEIKYRAGRFLAAYNNEASRQNEQNALMIVDAQGRKLGVVQIAGVMARRIVCKVNSGDNMERGERFGLIMFGSRTDLYLPQGCRVEVTEGQRVKGGTTIVGRFI
jgi:phosphatidylserine decarboxylase